MFTGQPANLYKALSITLLSACLSMVATGAEVVDDANQTVRLDRPAQRIVSLAPSLTEILFAVGAGEKIVGVVEYSDFPPAAVEIPVIGRHDLLDLEAILAMQPDLVVSWQSGNPATAVARLKQLGLTVYVAEPVELASIATHMQKLAVLAGVSDTGRGVVEKFNTTLDGLRQRYQREERIRVFYQVWDSPLITAGGNELINDMIELCGGQNIFAELSLVAPKISTESVLVRNPQVIIASGMDIARPEWLDSWLNWPQLEAVSEGHLYFIPPDLVQRHTPRALQGASQMCEHINRAR